MKAADQLAWSGGSRGSQTLGGEPGKDEPVKITSRPFLFRDRWWFGVGERLEGPPIGSGAGGGCVPEAIDRICAPASTLKNPLLQHCLLVLGEAFLGWHFTSDDTLPGQAGIEATGDKSGASLATTDGAAVGCQVQSPLGGCAAMAVQAMGCQQSSYRLVKIDWTGGVGGPCRRRQGEDHYPGERQLEECGACHLGGRSNAVWGCRSRCPFLPIRSVSASG